MIYKVKKHIRFLHDNAKLHWRRTLVYLGIGALGILMLVQFFYPSDRLVLFTSIDKASFSGWSKKDAIKSLDGSYKNALVPVYFGKAKSAYRSPKPADIGLVIKNESRINKMDYPWYLRIIPTSLFWAHFITDKNTDPNYQRDSKKLDSYIAKELGQSCDVKPKDATLRAVSDKLELVPSSSGGKCEIQAVKKILLEVKPKINQKYKLIIPVKEIKPDVNDEDAKKFGAALDKKASENIKLTVTGSIQTIPTTELFKWIDFGVVDGKISYSFNLERASGYLNKEVAPKVAVKAGTTNVSTYNFTETSRVNGPSGKRLDVEATLGSIKLFLDGGGQPSAITSAVAPQVIYSRSYSPTDAGLSALIQQYSQDHSGTFGVSMIELSGKNRRASYNGSKSFTTASTYKLFVAYSTLKRVEEGSWQWSDQIVSGRNLATCFDDMIVRSDNTCAAAMLAKVGYTNITNEARALGCVGTSFLGKENIKTTPADLALFLASLQSGQMLTQQASRDRLISAMGRNIYRQGIPAGLPGIAVSDKVGFMDGLLHDASIVYSPSGTYILVIMSDGSSWSTIADFARQIESLRI